MHEPPMTSLASLESWCRTQNLDWNDAKAAQFSRYIDLLCRYQKQTNLTGFSTPEAIIRELFIDSLEILRAGRPSGTMIDVGTGAGFPAIPIKIMIPELDVILVEPRVKRYAFLGLVVRELALQNVTMVKSPIEHVDVPASLQWAISKAFAPLPIWLETARPWAARGAQVACLVSKSDWESFDLERAGYRVIHRIEERNRVYVVVAIK